MKKFLPGLLVVLAIALGSYGAHWLKSGASTPEAGHEAADNDKADAHGKSDDHGKADSHGGKKSDAGGHGKAGDDHAGSGESMYFKFSREFVVPIMEAGQVESLVILNINLEADADLSTTLFSIEPKLRDNIMTTLIGLSGNGRTFDQITDVESYETLRSMILMNLKSVVAKGITNVLIVDVAKQEV